MLIRKLIHDFATPLSSLILMTEMSPNISPEIPKTVERLRDLLEFYRLVTNQDLGHAQTEKFLRRLCERKDTTLTYQGPVEARLSLVIGYHAASQARPPEALVFHADIIKGPQLSAEILDAINGINGGGAVEVGDQRLLLWQYASSKHHMLVPRDDFYVYVPR